jgi:ABC-type multidrug transport system ATPase subunit/pSer/pThr/pTyr-binding forkhead associated (FHA) protein
MSPHAAPALVVRAGGSDRTLTPGRSYKIGRDPQGDIVVADPRVSWEHAMLRVENGQWLLEDKTSTNGTYAGQQRIKQYLITGSCQVWLGSAGDGPVVLFSVAPAPVASAPGAQLPGAPAPGATNLRAQPMTPQAGLPPARQSAAARAPSQILQLPTKVLRIGRASDNDIVVADLLVSRYHAELRKLPADGYEIADLGSYNGTYVNGQRITSARVTDRDVIGVGSASYRMVGEQLQEFIDTGDVSLDARGLTVRLSSGKVILDDVSFPLGGRCLLGVIGPSGAGKSTLLGALTGLRPATQGTVFYDDRDLYANYDQLRHRIGLVPQENILHTQLSARKALGYAAELRFPKDTSKAERERRIEEVLGELALTKHADTRASSLSGGQQKRVNVALELLTKPSLLFLDEPTSGLDPGLDMQVMEMMSGLASDGRTVIVVTHSVANLHVCDRLLVLVPGGKVAFFGPPAEGLKHFAQPSWAHVFRAFEAQPDRDWAGEYRNSAYYQQYVSPPLGDSTQRVLRRQALAAMPPPPPPSDRFSQLSTLVRRYLAVIGSDRNYAAVVALLPIILGIVVRVIPDPHGLIAQPEGNGNAIQVLLILIMAACLTGVSNAVREIVKERPIYTRERAAGLSVGAYLWSKLVVLGVISAVQAVVLVLISLAGRPLPPHGALFSAFPLEEIMAAIAVLAVASMAAGLLISAAVNSSDKTLPLMVVVVLIEVVLSGGVFRLNGKAGLEQVSWLSPSRWGFGAAASTTNLNVVTPPPPGSGTGPDPLWNHNAHTWLMNMFLQALLGAAFAAITWIRLDRSGPGRR